MGTARAWGHAGGGRAISVHTHEASLPQSLPLAFSLCSAALACWAGRCPRDGAQAWRLLSRVLLGAVRRDGRCGSYELGLDASAHADRLRREGAAAGSER